MSKKDHITLDGTVKLCPHCRSPYQPIEYYTAIPELISQHQQKTVEALKATTTTTSQYMYKDIEKKRAAFV
ncbi:MAG: hypothetical protein LBQ60_11730 [Bacteroidales bacterium]|jgi:NMD protein affecting ribosome stability and mRNA decay|nr:hypothetical protein [Bacteroidales bacterium]